ncbi:MAG: ornithine cyclodeaminase [Woeseia sp.]|nr:ornithine cyclodeaminase [Woeseia sp.]|tara:strand:- start:1205 stop:2161 length:957 start_codon:yes stop_codon:yes gene_type:complete
MIFIGEEDVRHVLGYKELVEELRHMYCADNMYAGRELLDLQSLGSASGTCMGLMPAYGPGHDITTKIFTLFPSNQAKGLPTITAVIIVFDSETGELTAVVDGIEVTKRRTSAMCALASTYMSREDSKSLLVCGSGALAPHAALAHAVVRPIKKIEIWARRPDAAAETANIVRADRPDIDISVSRDLKDSCSRADIVSCQTSASYPIIFGDWISPGTHLDFVGSHDPQKRECDDEVVRKGRIIVDVMETSMREAGDILIPIANGTIKKSDVLGDLSDLCRSRVLGRQTTDDITVFKSTGSSLADMAAAELAVRNSVKRK